MKKKMSLQSLTLANEACLRLLQKDITGQPLMLGSKVNGSCFAPIPIRKMWQREDDSLKLKDTSFAKRKK